MYSISEVAKLTKITTFTLRYYEKIGIIPNPCRKDGTQFGVRIYDDQDVQFIQFIYGLKNTGMKLEDISEFIEDGCLLKRDDTTSEVQDILKKRVEILDRHLDHLERQIAQLKKEKEVALEKREGYLHRLEKQPTP